MIINTKSRCGMCRENKDSACFLNKEGRPTNLCSECLNLMETFISGRGTDEITGTAKQILTNSGMSVEQIADLVSPAAAADSVVMKAIGMDVFNNLIKPANVMPDSKLRQAVMRITAPPTEPEFKFGFKGMIGFDSAADSAQSPAAKTKTQPQQRAMEDLATLMQNIPTAPAPVGPFRYRYFSDSIPIPDEDLALDKTEAPPKPAEPAAEIGRVARAIAGKDEE